MAHLVREPRPRGGADPRQAPGVVQLQRVAVAQHYAAGELELDGLAPPPAVDTSPVPALFVGIRPVGLPTRRNVFRHHGPVLPRAPARLACRTWALDDNDHSRIVTYPPASTVLPRRSRSLHGLEGSIGRPPSTRLDRDEALDNSP